MYEYRAIVRDVHDGDTITVDVDLGWNVWRHHEPLRLAGIDAPELNTDAGKAARVYLAGLLPLGAEVVIRTERDKDDKFGRMLASIFPVGGPTYAINEALIRGGHAKAWNGKGPRP
jgi:micrococcal nuclease